MTHQQPPPAPTSSSSLRALSACAAFGILAVSGCASSPQQPAPATPPASAPPVAQLTRAWDAPAAPQPASSRHARDLAEALRPAPAPPKRYLIIGDSQVQHNFGFAFDYLMRNALDGVEITTHAVCASNPLSWVIGYKHNCGYMRRDPDFKALPDARGPDPNGVVLGRNRTPKMLDLLHTLKPDVVVITLGENGKKSGKKHLNASIHALARVVDCYRMDITDEATCEAYIEEGALPLGIAQVSEAQPNAKGPAALECVWFLPPYTRYDKQPRWLDGYHATFRKHIKTSCRAIDSRPLTCAEGFQDPQHVCNRDVDHGLHFGRPRARVWALATFDALARTLNLPNVRIDARNAAAASWGYQALTYSGPAQPQPNASDTRRAHQPPSGGPSAPSSALGAPNAPDAP